MIRICSIINWNNILVNYLTIKNREILVKINGKHGKLDYSY